MHGTLTIEYNFQLNGKVLSEEDQEKLEQHVIDTVSPRLPEGETEGHLTVSVENNGDTTEYEGTWALYVERNLTSCHDLLDKRLIVANHLLEHFDFPGGVHEVSEWTPEEDSNQYCATVVLDPISQQDIRKCTFHIRFPSDTSIRPDQVRVINQDTGSHIGSIDTQGPEVAEAIRRLTKH